MDLKQATDEQLMQRTSESDAPAFQELLNRYSRKVYALAWRLTMHSTDAEDLAQEVFLKIWKNASSWQPTAKLETWLYRVLYNHFIDTKRRQKPIENGVSENIVSMDSSPEQALVDKASQTEIAVAMEALPERQREALVLCYYQDLKAKEAADILSISTGALESLLFRARQTLKEKLAGRKEKSA